MDLQRAPSYAFVLITALPCTHVQVLRAALLTWLNLSLEVTCAF